ncbi:hypothetical protein R0K20_19100, partial [Staphylococcus sp. SIMBA_130]
MPLRTLEITLRIAFHILDMMLLTVFITELMMLRIKLKPVDTTFLAALTPLVNSDLTVFHIFVTTPRKPVNNALPA